MAVKKRKIKKTVKKISNEEIFAALNDRLDIIEKKMDSLLLKATVSASRKVEVERDPSFKTRATINRTFPDKYDDKPRKMHQAVCAECKAVCEVPFVPRADRPVYCKACYSNRKAGNPTQNTSEIISKMMESPEFMKISKAAAAASKTGTAKTRKKAVKTAKPKAKSKPKAKTRKPAKKAVKKTAAKKKKKR